MRCQLIMAALVVVGCRAQSGHLSVRRGELPAPPDAVVPQMTPLRDGTLAVSWLLPQADGGYAFQFTTGQTEAWAVPSTVFADRAIIMFTADLPGLADGPNGSLYAYWERRDGRGSDRYATQIQIARSLNRGASWDAPVVPYTDPTPGQHSFISAFPMGDSLAFVWLDARKQHYLPPDSAPGIGPRWSGTIGLVMAVFGPDGRPGRDAWVDSMTCECCPTAAAGTPRGPVVVYRGRDRPPAASLADPGADSVVRDIYLRRLERGRWTEPKRVHADNWIFNGCPDNGPAVDARGDTVAVAWWTGSGGSPKALVALSVDAGDHFGPSTRVDFGRAEGQVTVALAPRGVIVGWLEQGHTWARPVTLADGSLGKPVDLGPAPPHSRLPRWVATEDGASAAWTTLTADGRRKIEAARLVMH